MRVCELKKNTKQTTTTKKINQKPHNKSIHITPQKTPTPKHLHRHATLGTHFKMRKKPA